jgi:hypothetical protein
VLGGLHALGICEGRHEGAWLAVGYRRDGRPNAVRKNGRRLCSFGADVALGRERYQRAAAIVVLRNNVQGSTVGKIASVGGLSLVVLTKLVLVLQLGDAISGRHRRAKPLMIPVKAVVPDAVTAARSSLEWQAGGRCNRDDKRAAACTGGEGAGSELAGGHGGLKTEAARARRAQGTPDFCKATNWASSMASAAAIRVWRLDDSCK